MGFLRSTSRRIALVAALLCASAQLPLRAELEFSGYLRLGERDYFIVTDLRDGSASGWLPVGEEVQGGRIASFDRAQQYLRIDYPTGSLTLRLKSSAVAGSAAAEVSATVTRYGALRDFQAETQPFADSLGRPVVRFRNPWFGVVTTQVVAQAGVVFGFTATVSGLPSTSPVEVEYRFRVPRSPETEGTAAIESSVKLVATTDLHGRLVDHGVFYRLDAAQPVVAGTYRAELRYASRVLVAKDFTVGDPAESVRAGH